MEGHQPAGLRRAIGQFQDRWQAGGLGIGVAPLQGDAAWVEPQAVEPRAVQAGERFQVLQGVLLVKHLGVALDGVGRVVDAGATAAALLGMAQVGC